MAERNFAKLCHCSTKHQFHFHVSGLALEIKPMANLSDQYEHIVCSLKSIAQSHQKELELNPGFCQNRPKCHFPLIILACLGQKRCDCMSVLCFGSQTTACLEPFCHSCISPSAGEVEILSSCIQQYLTQLWQMVCVQWHCWACCCSAPQEEGAPYHMVLHCLRNIYVACQQQSEHFSLSLPDLVCAENSGILGVHQTFL